MRRESEESNGSGRGRRSKVARFIEEYDLQWLGIEIERGWTAHEDRSSLRGLAAKEGKLEGAEAETVTEFNDYTETVLDTLEYSNLVRNWL